MIVMLAVQMPLQAFPEQSSPPAMVNDFADLLSRQEISRLEQKLVTYNNSRSTQIAVVTVTDLEGYDIATYADLLAEEWGVGQAGKENGVMILIHPVGGEGERRIHIAVGYGLEGVIPDITAKRIVDQEILPAFRNGRYYEGLDRGTEVLMQLAEGEFTAEDYQQSGEPSLFALFFPLILMIGFFWLVSRGRRSHYSPGRNIPFWTLLLLMGSGGRGGSGGFGGGGSFGGGGFGGFGGGRFGGGGAGGSW